MTIAQLLSHHGHKAPRWINVDGEVVFTAPAAATATAVQPHTFHGGEDPEDVSAVEAPWWHDEEEVSRHVDAVKESFPRWHFIPSETDGLPCFAGEINTGRGTFKVLVLMRRDGGLPFVHVLDVPLGRSEGRHWRKAPHLFLSGGLCVADQTEWLPEEHTAATVIAWAAHWLAAYTEWRFTGKWPVEGFQPDAA